MTMSKKFLSLIIMPFLLVRCGPDVSKWPYCDLPDEIAQYKSVYIEMSTNKSDSNGDYTVTNKYTSVSSATVLEIYKSIEYTHISPNSVDVDLNDYWHRVFILFTDDSSSDYIFEFYSFGVKVGYCVFNKEVKYECRSAFFSIITDKVNNKDYFVEI